MFLPLLLLLPFLAQISPLPTECGSSKLLAEREKCLKKISSLLNQTAENDRNREATPWSFQELNNMCGPSLTCFKDLQKCTPGITDKFINNLEINCEFSKFAGDKFQDCLNKLDPKRDEKCLVEYFLKPSISNVPEEQRCKFLASHKNCLEAIIGDLCNAKELADFKQNFKKQNEMLKC